MSGGLCLKNAIVGDVVGGEIMFIYCTKWISIIAGYRVEAILSGSLLISLSTTYNNVSIMS